MDFESFNPNFNSTLFEPDLDDSFSEKQGQTINLLSLDDLGNKSLINLHFLDNKKIDTNLSPQKKESSNSSNNISNKFDSISKEKEKSKFGRKRKREKEKQLKNNRKVHDRNRRDNIQRKVKHIIIDSSLSLTNQLLRKIHINKQSEKKFDYQLIKINYKLIENIKAEDDVDFTNKTLKWIFCQKKSTKYKKYEKNHNANLIETSLNDSNTEDNQLLELILNMTFLEYMEFYIEKKYECIETLKGLKTFDEYCEINNSKEKKPDDEKYIQLLKDYAYNYIDNINKIKKRNPKRILNNKL